jgi:two-component system chemotaxis response regulator CheY
MMKTILIVDDSPTMRMLLKVHLGVLQNVRVVEATSTDDALAKKQQQSPAVIITDVNMPGKNGFELIQEIRDKQQDRLTGLVVVTTRGADEDAKKGLRLGANAYVTKPIDGPALVDTVMRLLR